VISDVPITLELLQSATSRLGSVTLIPPDRSGNVEVLAPAKAGPTVRKRVDAGRVPPPSDRFDPAFRFFTLFDAVDWESGKSQTGAIVVVSRPSILYTTLFAAQGDKTEILQNLLLGIAIFFGLIEFVALYIGVRTPPDKYATMFLGCYDATVRELKYCSTGHPPPIMLRGMTGFPDPQTSGAVVGLFDRATYDESMIAIQPGDIFVAFSDGVTEPENESGEFGEERLIQLLQEHRHQPLFRIGDIIIGFMADWIGGAEQPDDVTVVLARAR
jgi:hypothetical protein